MGGRKRNGKSGSEQPTPKRQPKGKSRRQSPKPSNAKRPGDSITGPAWLRPETWEPQGDSLPSTREPLLVAVLIGESRDAPWFSELTTRSRLSLLASLESLVKAASPDAPLIMATPGGFLSQPEAGASHSGIAAPLAAELGEGAVAFVGVDGPWAPFCDEQSIVPVTAGGAQSARWKLYPADIGGGRREGVPYAATSYRFEDRVVATGLGRVWPAVCHDLNAVPGVAKAYDAWTGALVPLRADLEAELPRPGKRSVSVVVNAVHQFRAPAAGGGGFGRFPGRTSAAAAKAQCATLTAAKFIGYNDTSWSAARHARTAEVVRADADWWVEGDRPENWVWMQLFRASSVGL